MVEPPPAAEADPVAVAAAAEAAAEVIGIAINA
jgi:hypothetical protein